MLASQLIELAPDAVPKLMAQFVEAFSDANRTVAERIVLVASAHHRLLWIHLFLDGNGRVARLMSHAMLRACGGLVDTSSARNPRQG